MVRGQQLKTDIELEVERNRRTISYREIIITTLRVRRDKQIDECEGMYIHWDEYEKIANDICEKIRPLPPVKNLIINMIQTEIEALEENLKKTALLYKAEYGM